MDEVSSDPPERPKLRPSPPPPANPKRRYLTMTVAVISGCCVHEYAYVPAVGKHVGPLLARFQIPGVERFVGSRDRMAGAVVVVPLDGGSGRDR